MQIETDALLLCGGWRKGKALKVVDEVEKTMVGSGLEKVVKGDDDVRQVVYGESCLGVASFKGDLSGVVEGQEEVCFEGLKEAQIFKGFSCEVTQPSSSPLERS